MDSIDQLMMYGLTRQEATLYLTLLCVGELTGYEAAKKTTISRSNTYNGLAGLVEKGAANIIEGSVTKYVPMEIEEFCNNKLRQLDEAKKDLTKKIPKMKIDSNGYITVKGNTNVMNKLNSMIEGAKERIYLSISSGIIEQVYQTLLEAHKRCIKLVIITDTLFEFPEDKKGNQTVQYLTEKKDNRIRIIVDSKKVLTGELVPSGDSTCLYSMNDNLVSVFKEMLQNEIVLLQLEKDK